LRALALDLEPSRRQRGAGVVVEGIEGDAHTDPLAALPARLATLVEAQPVPAAQPAQATQPAVELLIRLIERGFLLPQLVELAGRRRLQGHRTTRVGGTGAGREGEAQERGQDQEDEGGHRDRTHEDGDDTVPENGTVDRPPPPGATCGAMP